MNRAAFALFACAIALGACQLLAGIDDDIVATRFRDAASAAPCDAAPTD